MSISNLKIPVLFIHHSGVFGGASRSLFEVLNVLSLNSIEPILLTQKGTTSDVFVKANIKTFTVRGISQFDNTLNGYYRHFRWLILIREIFYLPYTYIGLKRIKKLNNTIKLIHINEITVLPAAIMAKYIFKLPIILHVRSFQRQPDGFRNKLIYKWINKNCSRVIAIDQTIKNSLPDYLTVNIIHNGLKFNPVDNITPRNSRTVFAMVSNLLDYKGVVDFVNAAVLAKVNNLDVTFRIIGANFNKSTVQNILKFFKLSHNVSKEIIEIIKKEELTNIEFKDFTMDISSIYANIDVLCFPSHLNAAGRPIFEAAFFKKPCIIAIKNPQSDTVIDYETGICVPEKSPNEIFNAIKYFYDNPEELLRMGTGAFELANKNFNIENNASKVFNIYLGILK